MGNTCHPTAKPWVSKQKRCGCVMYTHKTFYQAEIGDQKCDGKETFSNKLCFNFFSYIQKEFFSFFEMITFVVIVKHYSGLCQNKLLKRIIQTATCESSVKLQMQEVCYDGLRVLKLYNSYHIPWISN